MNLMSDYGSYTTEGLRSGTSGAANDSFTALAVGFVVFVWCFYKWTRKDGEQEPANPMEALFFAAAAGGGASVVAGIVVAIFP